jgi:hypothetical protein
MVRKWVRKFNKGHDNVHDEPQSGQLSEVSEVFTGCTFYKEGIQKLVPRYDKYLNNGGNYVEK